MHTFIPDISVYNRLSLFQYFSMFLFTNVVQNILIIPLKECIHTHLINSLIIQLLCREHMLVKILHVNHILRIFFLHGIEFYLIQSHHRTCIGFHHSPQSNY